VRLLPVIHVVTYIRCYVWLVVGTFYVDLVTTDHVPTLLHLLVVALLGYVYGCGDVLVYVANCCCYVVVRCYSVGLLVVVLHVWLLRSLRWFSRWLRYG